MPRRPLKRLLPIQPRKLPRPDYKGDSTLKGTHPFIFEVSCTLANMKGCVPFNPL